ncbi:MAG: hypothetical protein JXI33_02255 [Candidatus Aminicenantes bacterium]|nr:hypothetical protein [Candidatus Aminicenantes bacterium]
MKRIKKKLILKLNVTMATILLLAISPAYAQKEFSKWHLKINYASLKPTMYNDLWFVTSQGYHIHPRTESYTPGFSVSIEYEILKNNNLELMCLVGRPTAVLGIVDQFSWREPVFSKGYNFFAILLSPNVAIIGGHRCRLYISPVCGWGMTAAVSITPTFGPEVTWNRGSEFIYGLKSGFRWRMKNKRFFMNLELIGLSMNAELTENQTNRELNKKLGPLGILLGFSFALD